MLIDELKAAIRRGLRPGGIWKKEATTDVIATFRESGQVCPTARQVNSKRDGLKTDWKQVEELMNISGFGIDPENGRITASDATWTNLLSRKPELKRWKTKTIPLSMKADLDLIFGGTAAIGAFAQSRDAGRETYESISREMGRSSQSAFDEPPLSSQAESQLLESLQLFESQLLDSQLLESDFDSQVPVDPASSDSMLISPLPSFSSPPESPAVVRPMELGSQGTPSQSPGSFVAPSRKRKQAGGVLDILERAVDYQSTIASTYLQSEERKQRKELLQSQTTSREEGEQGGEQSRPSKQV